MDRSNLPIYVCGPMSGLKQFNIPLFDLTTLALRSIGHDVISPAELDSPEMRALAMKSENGDMRVLTEGTGETWGDVLARDVRMIEQKVGSFVLLPGWKRSRGARLEVFVALLVGIIHFREVTEHPQGLFFTDVAEEYVRQAIRENMP